MLGDIDEEKDFYIVPNADDYEKMFKKLGHSKSKKLIIHLQQKVLSFDFDFNNSIREEIMSKLKMMRTPYMRLYKEPLELLMFAPRD